MATHEAGDVCRNSHQPKLKGQKHFTHGMGYKESRQREEQAQTRATQQPQESSKNRRHLTMGGGQWKAKADQGQTAHPVPARKSNLAQKGLLWRI